MEKYRMIQFGMTLCVVLFSKSIWASEPIRFTLMEYPPFMSKKMNEYGVLPAIVTAAFKRVDTDVVYNFYPPARTFANAKAGEFDGTVGWVHSDEREKAFHYSDPIFEGPLVFFHLKSVSFDWETVDCLKQFEIGIVLKNFYGRSFHNALDAGKLKVQKVPLDKQNFDKLLAQRITLVPLNLHVGLNFIKNKYHPLTANRITYHPRPLKTSIYHILFSKAVKGNEAKAKLFNQGLRLLKKSGEYQEIIAQFNLKKDLVSIAKTN